MFPKESPTTTGTQSIESSTLVSIASSDGPLIAFTAGTTPANEQQSKDPSLAQFGSAP